MIRNTWFGGISDLADGLNIENRRNIKNTNKRTYNCGGYALGTYSWYCPYRDELEDYFTLFDDMYSEIEDEDRDMIYDRITRIAVRTMLEDFAHRHIRVISEVTDRKENETVVAFRHDLTDFHYLKMGANGVWYSKMGGSNYITTYKAEEVLDNSSGWDMGHHLYDSKIILLALERENA